jgi:hypothetical protein
MALTRPRLGQLNTSVVAESDPITVLHAGSTLANVDVGFVMNRANGLVSNVALYWSESGNTFVTAFTSNSGSTDSNITATSYANVTTGHLLPGANVTYNLGSPTQRWNTLYIAGNTIDIGGHTISTASGQITFSTPQGGLVSGIFSTLSANANTPSTSTTTGTMVIAGGAGISGNLYIGGNLDVAGTTIFRNIETVTTTEYVSTINATNVYAATIGNIGSAYIGATGTFSGTVIASTINAGTIGNTGTTLTGTLSTASQPNITSLGTLTSLAVNSGGITSVGSIVAGTLNAATIGNSGAVLTGTLSTASQPNITSVGTLTSLSISGALSAGSFTVPTASQPNITSLGTLTGLTISGATQLNNTLGVTGVTSITNTTSATNTVTGALTVAGGAGVQGSLYAGALYDNANRVLSTTTGSGNLLISGTQVTLPATGPGAITVGSSTSIPVVTTDAYGRVVALTGASISTTLNLAGTNGTGAVALGSQTFTFASTNGVVATASGTTVTLATAQDIRTTATPTFAGLTTSGATQINSTLGVTGVTSITNSTVSSGAGNGALVITGGIGAGATSYFGGDLYVTGNIFTPNLVATNATTLNTSSPMVYFQATPYPYNFETGFYSHFIGGPANVYAHTGFVRNHNNNVWTLFSNVKSEPSSTTINFADTGLIWDTLQLGGIIVSNTTTSTSTTSGALVVSGGVGISGNLNVNNAAYIGYNAINTTLTNPTIVATSSSNSVNAGQFYVQNALLNSSGSGSADFIAYGNNYPGSNNDHGWMDMGFTGNSFSDPAYGITKSNDGYLFASAVSGTSLGGNLVLATDNTGTYNDIVFATGSFAANAEVARFHGNATTAGYLQITTGTTSTSTATGALRISGGIGITGNVYSDKLFVTNGIYWAGNNNVISSGGGGSAPAGVNGQVQYNNGGTLGPSTIYNYVANSAVVITNTTTASSTSTGALQVLGGTGITGALYAGLVYDNGNRVLTNLSSSGAGNLTVSVSAPASSTIALPTTGPGAVTVGSSTSIPVITTDAYGRISALTSSAVSTTINLAGTTGTGTVAGGGTLTFASTNGVTATVSSSTVTISSPQDLRTTATPTFAGGTFTGNVVRSSRPLITNYTGPTAPSSPIQGDEWWYTTGNILYKYINDGTTNSWVSISSALYNASTSATASTLALRDTGGSLTATTFIGKATSAQYADLAENYISDLNYAPGTVVIFGGEKEITVTDKSHDPRVAGVVSTNPAYLMNSECNGLPVAFTGRVPCLVQGPVTKGQLLVTSNKVGVAHAIDNTQFVPGCVIGKSLENITTNEITTIEVVVGRF